MTDLPLILKGITSVADARKAVEIGADAIFLFNHGGRHLDGAPSPLQVALAIHDEAPEIYKQVDVLADGGVRYGSDVLKFFALGVMAVGLGRSFMYAKVYGQPGVERAIERLKMEVLLNAVNLGVTDLGQLNEGYVRVTLATIYHSQGKNANTMKLDLSYVRKHGWDMW